MARRNRTDLRALRNIDEAHLLLSTTELPENRSKRACELLGTAVKLADHLLSESPAVTLGKLAVKRSRNAVRTTSENLPPNARRAQAEGRANPRAMVLIPAKSRAR